jgi:enamine deaminase RidA (YjgF/YER057c/UK114 family)
MSDNNYRKNFASGSPWEEVVGYSRAVKMGNIIEVSGTTAMDGEKLIGTTVYEQTRFIFKKIEKVLEEAGARMDDVVRTRMFITDISKWEEAGRAHGEFFKHIKPCATMVEVSRLISNDLLIEIEVSAVISP